MGKDFDACSIRKFGVRMRESKEEEEEGRGGQRLELLVSQVASVLIQLESLLFSFAWPRRQGGRQSLPPPSSTCLAGGNERERAEGGLWSVI